MTTQEALRPMAGVVGVNATDVWRTPVAPTVPDQAQPRDVLLVDRHGQPLIVRQPRPVGFRKP